MSHHAARYTRFVFAFLVLLNAFALTQEKKVLTLEDIFASHALTPKSVQGIEWVPGESAFTYLKTNPADHTVDIYKHDIASGKETLVLAGKSLTLKPGGEPIQIDHFYWSSDRKHLLIASQVRRIWRHSTEGQYFIYELPTKKLRPLSGMAGPQRNAKFSPEGSKVGFVRHNNLFVVDLATGVETQLTTDGSEDIINGQFDWVYEEEFSIADGWRWSPDSKKIAFWRIDQTRVRAFPLEDMMPLYPTIFWLKYPKAGEPNALVQIGVLALDTGKTNWMDLGEETDIYIPRIQWTPDPRLLSIQRLNRLQNKLDLMFADVNSGATRVVVSEQDPCWVDVQEDLTFLAKKEQFIWTSERSGYRHAYLYDYNGRLLYSLTSGEWEISAVSGLDEGAGWLYFSGKKDSPIEEHVYRVSLDGKNLERLSQRRGWHSSNFSPDFKYVIGTFSDVQTPPQISLRKNDGGLIRWLEKNESLPLSQYRLVYPQFLTVKTSDDGTLLNAWMMKPANFDSTKKYPVIVFCYSGPGAQHVVNRWEGRRYLWHQLMTEKGYLIFCIDSRGTGGRGKKFKNLVYGDLGKWSTHDQVEGAKYLASLPYVDPSRIGIWGHSGGGYLTAMTMTKGAGYFKAGIARAPVTDFRLYDTIWTERYMGLPKENEAGYRSSSVMTYADKLQGKLLLVHGMADDNVHMQNTVQLQDALQAANKQFEVMYYHGRNHRISGGNTDLHLHTLMTNFFLTNL
ncbi:MAG: S9 family peptidase [candidate division KSB1 bacterium]|nr:S9 family peptidase [candidate division KSB1 bacterium]